MLMIKPSHTSSTSFQSATAADTAHLFFDNIIHLHGLPQTIVSDCDSKFTSAFWRTIFSRFSTKLAFASSYHPQSDGQSECMVRTLKDMLHHYVSAKQTNWYEHLAALEFAYNSSVNPLTGQTPFQLNLGYSPHTPHSLLANTSNLPNAESFLATLQSDLQAAHDALAFAQSHQAHYHNLHQCPASFAVGDLV